MRKLFQNFIKCGILGWCLEITFTDLQSLRRRDLTLRGVTSLWMFPIYGAGCLLTPVFRLFAGFPGSAGLPFTPCSSLRANIYPEAFCEKKGICPWDYGRARWNVDCVIRLDYIPCWAAAGLLMERATRDASRVPRR